MKQQYADELESTQLSLDFTGDLEELYQNQMEYEAWLNSLSDSEREDYLATYADYMRE